MANHIDLVGPEVQEPQDATGYAYYIPGIADTRAIYGELMAPNPLTRNFILRNLGIGIFTGRIHDPMVFKMTLLIAKVKAALHQQDNVASITMITVGELMAPNVDEGLCLPRDACRERFIRAVVHLMRSNVSTIMTTVTGATWAEATTDPTSEVSYVARNIVEAVRPAYSALPWPAAGAPGAFDITVQTAYHILHWFAGHMRNAYHNYALETILTTHLMMARRGSVSEGFLAKFTEGIREELGLDLNLEPDVISLLYKAYGGYIDESNAGSLFSRWNSMVPEHALRLKLTLSQTALAGLTSYVTITEARRKCPGFNWRAAYSLLSGEFDAYVAATGLINNNRYYGYKRDLGVASASHYRSLAWLAKELLIKVEGEAALARYAGWVKTPRHKDALMELITAYVPRDGAVRALNAIETVGLTAFHTAAEESTPLLNSLEPMAVVEMVVPAEAVDGAAV